MSVSTRHVTNKLYQTFELLSGLAEPKIFPHYFLPPKKLIVYIDVIHADRVSGGEMACFSHRGHPELSNNPSSMKWSYKQNLMKSRLKKKMYGKRYVFLAKEVCIPCFGDNI